MSCIIVLGCYRSGTSAIAGVLNHLGVFMGKEFDPPTANNINGYYEDVEIKSFHSRFDAGELEDNPELMNDYVDLLKSREINYKIWGLKDPLLCTNMGRFVQQLRKPHKLIVCHRPVNDIALSMAKAMREPNLIRYMPLAEFYVTKMHEQISNYQGPILELSHQQTLLRPEFHIRRIARFVGLPVKQNALFHIVKST